MSMWLGKSVQIQPRTSPGKSDVSWLCSWMEVRASRTSSLPARRRAAGRPCSPLVSRARSRLDQRRFLQPRPHFAALKSFSRSTRLTFLCTAPISKFQESKSSNFLARMKSEFHFAHSNLEIFQFNLAIFQSNRDNIFS